MGGFLQKYTLKKKVTKPKSILPLGKMNPNYTLRTYPALVYRPQYLQGNNLSLTLPIKQTNKKSANGQSFLVILFGTDSTTVSTTLGK